MRVVSHDLRSPLTALSGQAQLLAARSERGSWAAARAGDILRVASRMASMIDDLVDGARYESRQLRLDLEAVDLGAFLGEVLQRMSSVLPCERIDLQISGERPSVRADPARLERIVVNLLSNALRYSPKATRVALRVEPAGDRVVLAIVDHGPGVADEDRQHLFQPYRRGRSAVGTSGVGLGLHSTQILVRAHGGTIQLQGTPGGGATFRVELPAVAPPRGSGQSAQLGTSPSHGRAG